MDIVVRGRNVEVPDHYRQHVAEKLARIERYDHHILRADVELNHEKNPRQSDICQRVEITCRVKGPVVRAEACAADFYKALDLAVERLERRFRQAANQASNPPWPAHPQIGGGGDQRARRDGDGQCPRGCRGT